MSDSTSLLTQLTTSQAGKEATVNELMNAASPATVFGRRQSSSGLAWDYFGGRFNANGTLTAIGNGTLTLTASTTCYIEVNPAGTVSFNTTGFTAGSIPLYSVVTGASTVTSYLDFRHPHIPLAVATHGATSKVTPVDLDELPIADSATAFTLKKLTWANLKATLAAWINGNLIAGYFTSLTSSGVSTVSYLADAGADQYILENTSSANVQTKFSGIQFRGRDTINAGKDVGKIRVYPIDANYVSSYMGFWTRTADTPTERMRIYNTGNIVIGGSLVDDGVNRIQIGGNASVSGNASVMGTLNTQKSISTVSTGYPNTGLTIGWNFTGAQGEVDFLLGPQGGQGGLNIYQLNSSGAIVSAAPIFSLSSTGALANQGPATLSSGYTVATLPAGTAGARAYVTDATAPTYLGALTGGGTVTCPVFYNGTAWVSA